MVAIFQPIFSFIHCYHLQFHRRFQPFPLLSFAIPIAPFHTVSLGLFTPPPSLPPPFPRFFFFCFTPLRSLQPVLRQPVIPPLFFWLANCAHTRALEHTKRHLSLSLGSPLFFLSLSSRPRTVARSTVANCEYAHYRYLQTARAHAPAFLVPDFHQNRRIVRSIVSFPFLSSFCRIFFVPSPLDVFRFREESSRRLVPFFEL